MSAVTPVLVVHGGAWALPDRLMEGSLKGVVAAARRGYGVLMDGGSAVDGVEAAVNWMEDDPVFDAGHGSVLNTKGEIEMDAMIMEGRTMRVGSVACVQNIAHPVTLARSVMEKTEHTMLVGQGANDYATEIGMEQVPPEQLLTEEARKEFETYHKFKNTIDGSFRHRADVVLPHDTVGAVAIDREGNVACATSTGGITAKRPGRVGDSPLVGSGGFADNDCGAISTTGHGEAITRVCLAHLVTTLMKQGSTPQVAAEKALRHMAQRVGGSGGVIVLDRGGAVGTYFTTERMPWVSVRDNTLEYGINPQDHFVENYLNPDTIDVQENGEL